jgi:hypothetical protein
MQVARAYETLSDDKMRRLHDEDIGLGESLNMNTAFSYS